MHGPEANVLRGTNPESKSESSESPSNGYSASESEVPATRSNREGDLARRLDPSLRNGIPNGQVVARQRQRYRRGLPLVQTNIGETLQH